MNNSILLKAKALVFALTISGASFGQLNNCINTKEHPLIIEIIDSVKANPNYKSMLAYAVISGDRIGLARSTVLNLAFGWASCKKIKDPTLRKEEELKYIDAFFSSEELEKLVSYYKKYRDEKK
jgi:hypothetical protein